MSVSGDTSDMSAYAEIFQSESQEFLQLMNDALLALEDHPADLAPVDEVFRAAHSLKGMAAAMGYGAIAQAAHELEELVDTLRRRERQVTRELVDVLLSACDRLGAGIAEAAAGGSPDAPMAELVAGLREVAEAPSAPPPRSDEPMRYRVDVKLEDNCVLRSVRAYMVLKRLSRLGEVVETAPPMVDIEDEQFGQGFAAIVSSTLEADKIVEAVMEISEIEDVKVRPAPLEEAAPRSSGGPMPPRVADSQTVRVSVGHIDEMVNLVGELVIVRSRLEQMALGVSDADLRRAVEELGLVTSALQQVVLRTRMVPVSHIFNRFPRMVRDSARDLGREVDFEMDGLDIELDRTVLDEIGDPLVHLLRNAVSHGAEPPEERERSGKPRRATVRLSAAREKTSVTITVEDDGRGIDREAVSAKAVERGLLSAEAAQQLGPEETYGLICMPGFSTAESTTELSGRGVGLDAVKEKIEQLGGSVTITSERGRGSRFTLALPLTLAIIHALLLEDASNVYAIPITNVVEAHATDELTVKTVEGGPCALLAGRVVPLARLQEALGRDTASQASQAAGRQVVVVAWRDSELGLVVDRLVGKQEIVIKPLPAWLKGAIGVAGATVLGDGRVALIVDVRGLISQSKEVRSRC